MAQPQYVKLKSLLKHKKNIILQGAPGVGKTFAAERLAWAMMEEKDDGRIQKVQFHQNVAYEDFVMGYKPDGNGFKLQTGVFYDFCKKAEADQNRDYFFIIDEINRGNLSKIFGELLMLIEKDHRTESVHLAYDKDCDFSVPKNLYIIGMMNTADRSLAMIDYALRRRFSFFDMEPAFDVAGFQAYLQNLHSEKAEALAKAVVDLNEKIKKDATLGEGFCIGHSYFCGHENDIDDSWVDETVEYDLIPTLKEYWFDDRNKYEKEAENLRDAILGVINE